MEGKKDKNSGAVTHAMNKLTDAINSLDIDEPPLKSWDQIVKESAYLRLVKTDKRK